VIKCTGVGAFVYRLGHGLLKAERGVRFPYALPILFWSSDTNAISHFLIFQKRKVRIKVRIIKFSIDAFD
jgi:hypothetical protein